MKRSSSATLGVAAIGVSNRQEGIFKHFFQERCGGEFSLTTEQSAAILIIDIDQPTGRERLQPLATATDGKPLLLLALSPDKVEVPIPAGATLVQKPIQGGLLVSALHHARAQLLRQSLESGQQAPDTTHHETHHAADVLDIGEAHSFIGSAPDIDPTKIDQVNQACHNPERFLIGHIREAFRFGEKQQRVMRLESSRGFLLCDPHTNTIVTNIKESHLRTLAAFPDVDVSIHPYTEPVGGVGSEPGCSQLQREPMLWKCALWAARGRLPEGVALNQPVYLTRWPNFTRLILFPHALQIAAALNQHPRPLLDLAQLLAIPQRYIFAFYSAADAVGLVGIARRDSDTLFTTPAIEANGLRGLFGRLVSHLRSEPGEAKERA